MKPSGGVTYASEIRLRYSSGTAVSVSPIGFLAFGLYLIAEAQARKV